MKAVILFTTEKSAKLYYNSIFKRGGGGYFSTVNYQGVIRRERAENDNFLLRNLWTAPKLLLPNILRLSSSSFLCFLATVGAKAILIGHVIRKGNKDHFSLDDIKFDMTVKQATIHLNNLFNGSQQLGMLLIVRNVISLRTRAALV